MSVLYVITGPAAVGKSTVSNRIAALRSKCALIEGDDIYHQVVSGFVPAWLPNNHLSTFWKVCISSIKAYLNDGFDVVFNYIVSFDDLEVLKREFRNFDFRFVVLIADEDSLLVRDKQRPIDFQMGDRCLSLLDKFTSNGFYSKFYLDTSNLSVFETVNAILNSGRFSVK